MHLVSRAFTSPDVSGFEDMTVKGSIRLAVVCLGIALVGTSVGAGVLKAQTEEAPGSKRKVKSLGRPQYSDLAKKLNLSGTVKVEVTVGADGKVKRTHVLGGHPVLAVEAEKAAMQSEFEAGPRETTEVIEFKFGNQ